MSSAHEVFDAVMTHEGWTRRKLAATATASARAGGVSVASAEAFLDQLVTWRELGFNVRCAPRRPRRATTSLPAWARATLEAHAADRAAAPLHADAVRAARRPTIRCGTRRSGSWCARAASTTTCACCGARRSSSGRRTPREALDDDDRAERQVRARRPRSRTPTAASSGAGPLRSAWGPEREIFGTVRYMSSENTARKLRVKGYLARYGPSRGPEVRLPRGRGADSVEPEHDQMPPTETRAFANRVRLNLDAIDAVAPWPLQGASGHSTRAHADWSHRAAAREPLLEAAGDATLPALAAQKGGRPGRSRRICRGVPTAPLTRSAISSGTSVRPSPPVNPHDRGDRPLSEVSVYSTRSRGVRSSPSRRRSPRQTCACSEAGRTHHARGMRSACRERPGALVPPPPSRRC